MVMAMDKCREQTAMFYLIIVVAALVTGMNPARAAPDQQQLINEQAMNATSVLESGDKKKLNGRSLQEQYGGLVMDRTITVGGHDFYGYFTTLWRDKLLNEQFTLSVVERPSARWGNRIWIEFANRKVFETVLPANRSYIKSISEQAVEIVHRNAIDAEVQRLLFREDDIGPDEM
ncbi:CsgE family curli-type amyloid fiber assembly protein [Herbaspirillum sp. ST 5-3]|uniref:CsgE family curli-type amyloid fiber assembly protein n=1 Tax=Oxalobacteraceae TaxID=75682 RepID=UPI0010A3CF87|nr:CsgE family curli-type amyloid fiber assembly protein [Herbaspirillum sp. ST 5-3]